MIKNLFLKKEFNLIEWSNDNEKFEAQLDNIDQAMIDESRQLIFLLSGISKLPDKLDVLNEIGKRVFSCSPPVGAQFYYLTPTPAYEVLVVCTFEEKMDGWHDWHYSFDLEKCGLKRVSPVY